MYVGMYISILDDVVPRAQHPDANDALRLYHVEPARVLLRHPATSPPQIPDSLHRLAKEQSHRLPDFLFGHAYEDGKRGHRGDYAQEADPLFAGFVARMEDTRLQKCMIFGELVGGAGCVGGRRKSG